MYRKSAVDINGFIEYKTLDLRNSLEMKPNLKIQREKSSETEKFNGNVVSETTTEVASSSGLDVRHEVVNSKVLNFFFVRMLAVFIS